MKEAEPPVCISVILRALQFLVILKKVVTQRKRTLGRDTGKKGWRSIFSNTLEGHLTWIGRGFRVGEINGVGRETEF